jgi:hypothetical protein
MTIYSFSFCNPHLTGRLKLELKSLLVVDDLFSSEERTVIKAEKAVVLLRPSKSLKTFALGLLPFGIGEDVQYRAWQKGLKESDVSRHTRECEEPEYGDLTDITNKYVLVQPLTLTNRNLILSYNKGLKKKRNLVLRIHLEYLKSVQEKRMPRKNLELKFEARGKVGNLVSFDILLMKLSDSQAWLGKINQLIAERSTSGRLPSLK